MVPIIILYYSLTNDNKDFSEYARARTCFEMIEVVLQIGAVE
jgi:hypothetical protein